MHIGHADGDKRIGGQHTVRIMNVVGIVQPERETQPIGRGQRLADVSVLVRIGLEDFFFLFKMNFGRQIFVMRFGSDGYQRRVSVDGFQFDFIHLIAERVSFGCGNLHQLVSAQRQLLRPICTRSAGRDGVHPFIFLMPDCSIAADDFLSGAHLENSARKAAFFKEGRLIFKAHFGLSFKADEL